MSTPDHDLDALPAEPLNYRAGAFYVLAFLLVPVWLYAANRFLLQGMFGISRNALDPSSVVPFEESLRRHGNLVLALNVMLGAQAAGALATWLLRGWRRSAAVLAGLTVVLALCTFGARTPPAPQRAQASIGLTGGAGVVVAV
ncbi:hypothetical protein QEZ54_21375 [Catellatospora sp. KI3]|uniref:hypothetical protein n=1 Tax=Catellatospora sp. KI3 TaxID=3041620 RepID=UPI00248312D8|nr:hypothetical protein [Catellatospora sp. KI3]MDI1463537.1 hypothetical protein [Catellatospora sp. KI3]